MALQRVDSSIVIPYWDWSADASAPELSPVFSSTWYGKNGNQRRRGCVEDGYFKDYAPYYQDRGQGCISRRWNGGQHSINAFVFPEQIANLVARSSDYNRFCTNIGGQPHGAVHHGLGSSFATMYSTTDPVFWLHHAFIDKIFMDWQLLAPSTRLNQFNGVDHNRRSVNANSMLIPYNLPARVGLQTTVMGACISYAPAVNAYRGRRVPQPPTRNRNNDDDDDEEDEDDRPVRRPTRTRNTPTRRVIVRHSQPTRRVVRRIRPRSVELSTAKDINQAVSADDNAFPVDPSKAVEVQSSSSALEDTNLNAAAQQDVAPPAEEISKVEPIKEEAPKPAEEAAKQVTKVEAAAGDEIKPETKVEESKPQEPTKVDETKVDTKEKDVTKAKADEQIKPHDQVVLPANSTSPANATNTTDLSGTKVVVVDAPKPSDLPKTCKDADGNVTPCADDRENILDLRAPAPIPEEWIKSNNLDVELVRQQEAETRTIAAKLNALDGYVSPAALWNKEDFMAELAKKGTDFKCVVRGKVIKVEYNKENVTTGYRTVEKVKKQIERVGVPTYKPIEYLETDLNKILGRRTVKRLKKKFNKTPTVYKEIKYDDDDVCEADEY